MIKGGFKGKILRVNLSTEEIKTEELREDWAKKFIGGRGYGTRIIVEEIDPKIDPLSEENKVVIATGPLGGTLAPSSGRAMVITKGPLTGTIACSNVGGYFGPALKHAGFDMVIIEGKAKEPVYLWIYKGEAELKCAKDIWGKLADEADKILREKTHPKAETMEIGSAGEKKSLVANVMFNGHRAAGRTGVGAVLGSKNFKGIAVRGNLEVKVAEPEKFMEAVYKTREILSKNDFSGGGAAMLGTAMLVNAINGVGAFPTKNAQDGYFPEAEKISGETLRERNLIRNEGCAECPIGCGRVTEIKEGKYKGAHGGGPEYESIWALGAMCEVSDLDAVVMANYLCDKYGMDTITAGSTVACGMELYEKEYMPKEDSPFPLTFGSGEALVEAIKLMGEQKGKLGKLLSQGSYRLGEHYGHPELSMSVKKQEFPAYDPRGIKGIGLEYATSNRGACHVRGYTIAPEVLTGAADRLKYEGKGELVKTFQDLTSALDSTGICLFTTFGMGGEDIALLLSTATGFKVDVNEFMKIGERIWNLERLFNLKAGFSRKDDTLPMRILKEPIKTGPSKGEIEELDKMLDDYYKVRGWDKNGVPTNEKLKALGLLD
ncbi:MAG: aldehyde ferredoxin oxidoreductase family protein [Candidatus Caldatribacteriota bacterium]|nr:aldehyde ferredoxin oxidoreductase family protein [Candidatus Caldatribacteriota bacterium]